MPTIGEMLELAVGHHRRGELNEAQRLYRLILENNARQPDAWHLLGLIAYARGRDEQALECIDRAIALDDRQAAFHNHRAETLLRLQRWHEAETSCRRALALEPRDAVAHNTLGTILAAQSDHAAARDAYRRAIALAPELAQAHYNLGLSQAALGEPAEGSYRRAIELNPGYSRALTALGILLQQTERHEEAETCYRRAIDANPQDAVACANLGTLHKRSGRFAEAAACYDAALEIDPNLAEAHRNRATLKLLQGDLVAGFAEYEWRRRVPGIERTTPRQPRWNGETRPRATLLLLAEQGLGDTLQFVRYAQRIKRRFEGQVVLHAPARLHALLNGVQGIDRLTDGAQAAAFDYYLPLQSAPCVWADTLATIPADVPYLPVDPRRSALWRARLPDTVERKIGIAWQGNPQYEDDRRRSIPLAEFAPLADVPRVRLHSLQKGHGCEQLPRLSERLGVIDLASRLDTGADAFVDTAAVLPHLDLVIASDSALAHLAGALGVPVWVALAKVPDWRFLLDREDSPWYPTMRLFRQRAFDQWTDVFARMAAELAASAPRSRSH